MSADAEFQRPHPNTLRCEDCGHLWFEGERRHQYVDPAGEISLEDGADVVCTLCMHRRRRWGPEHEEDEEVEYW